MRKLLLIYTGSFLLASCATAPAPNQPRVRQVSIPEVGVETVTALGDRMLLQGSSTLVKGITLSEPNKIQTDTYSAGFYPQISEDKNYTYHSVIVGSSFNGLGSVTGMTAPRIESLRASKTKVELCPLDVLRSLAFGFKSCDTEHSYSRTEQELAGVNDFQQSLIYSGRIGDRIRISYREFSGGAARSAFTNEAEYDLSTSKTISYKGASIQVIDANNQAIKFVLMKNFNTEKTFGN